MSLRVLLADESPTIKKVMQLALQDFGVEVKAVAIGLDVIQVAKSYNPDIIFADVLLAKRNGYEVSADLKKDPTLKKVPVVLMWSGFMEIDEEKAKASKCDRRLEKPFDADTLRSIVRDLVPPTQANEIAEFLSFPSLPPIIEEEKKKAPEPEVELAEMATAKPTDHSSSHEIPIMDIADLSDDDEAEDFQQVPLPKSKDSMKQVHGDDWSRADLTKFKINLPKEDFSMDMDEADLTRTSIALSSGADDVLLEDLDSPIPAAKTNETISKTFQPTQPNSMGSQLASFDPMKAEEILRQEVRAVLESIAWKILPDMAERVIREELQKLLKDAERL